MKKVWCFIMVVFVFTQFVGAQDDLEKLYLRKAVKEYVGKNYDGAISNLKQVLVSNPDNEKAKKLISKAYAKKGLSDLNTGKLDAAQRQLSLAVRYDGANEDARDGLKRIESLRAKQTRQVVTPSSTGSKEATQIVVQAPSSQGTDTTQTKIIMNILDNFKEQQKAFTEQVQKSNEVLSKSQDSKDEYLEALVKSAESSRSDMKRILMIGGGIAGGVVLLLLIVFIFIFYNMNQSGMRTIEAANNIATMIAAPGAASDGKSPLMLTGPDGQAPGPDAASGAQSASAPAAEQKAGTGAPVQPSATVSEGTTVDSLSNNDPVQRARAVEAVAAEMVDTQTPEQDQKIKKLEELLYDANNRVRANAAKAIHDYEPEKAIKTLKGMLADNSKRMRASAVWALGEIASQPAADLTLSIVEEDDEIVKYNIKMALEKIKSKKAFDITPEYASKIDESLEKYKGLV